MAGKHFYLKWTFNIGLYECFCAFESDFYIKQSASYGHFQPWKGHRGLMLPVKDVSSFPVCSGVKIRGGRRRPDPTVNDPPRTNQTLHDVQQPAAVSALFKKKSLDLKPSLLFSTDAQQPKKLEAFTEPLGNKSLYRRCYYSRVR